ncbi:hypothetical protein LCGC14_2716420, partial [marine sediment metagenome]
VAVAMRHTTVPIPADALECFERRKYEDAYQCLIPFAKADRDLPPPEIIMAHLFRKNGANTPSTKWLERAVASWPNDPEAYILLAEIGLESGEVTAAQLLLEKGEKLLASFDGGARRREALRLSTLSALASVAKFRRDWPTVEAHLRKVLKRKPADSSAWARLAEALFKQNRPIESLAVLKKQKAVDKGALAPEASLGRFYQEFGDMRNAEIWMDRAVTVAPNDLRTRLAVGDWALRMHRFSRASAEVTEALRIDPSAFEAIVWRGVVALFEADYGVAEQFLARAEKIQPNSTGVTINLSIARLGQVDDSKHRDALVGAIHGLVLTSNSPEALITYMRALCKVGRKTEAQRVLDVLKRRRHSLDASAASYLEGCAEPGGPGDPGDWPLENEGIRLKVFSLK